MSQGLSPLPKPCYSQQLALPPDPGSCLVAGFPPCPQRSALMSPPPSASPKLHDLSSATYSKGMASPSHGPLGLQRPAGGVLASPEAPRPVGVHPGSPQQPPPTLLQPQVSPQLSSSRSPGGQPALCPHSPSSALPPGAQEPTCLQPCSPARPPGMGHQQHQLPKVPETESAAAGPLPLPEVCEDSNQGLAPTPVSVKREPQELDQLYLDDGKCLRPQARAWPGAVRVCGGGVCGPAAWRRGALWCVWAPLLLWGTRTAGRVRGGVCGTASPPQLAVRPVPVAVDPQGTLSW